MLKTNTKRGPGRPPKANKTTVKKVGKKRGRGRPLGSKNKPKPVDVVHRIDRLEKAVAVLAEILSDIFARITTKKGK